MIESNYFSLSIKNLTLGEPLPSDIYLFIASKFILYRSKESLITPDIIRKLQNSNIQFFFIKEEEKEVFQQWLAVTTEYTHVEAPKIPLIEIREQSIEALHLLFSDQQPFNEHSIDVVGKQSAEIVKVLLQSPGSIKPLNVIHQYSTTILEHSLNVAFLSVYCAAQMGYDHKIILEKIAMGALLHDIGQTRMTNNISNSDKDTENELKQHPNLSLEILSQLNLQIPSETQMIIAQHHEFHDGSGYPLGLKGSQIYDLSKIVAPLNLFDHLTRSASGPWALRQKRALNQLNEEYYERFDLNKLSKIISILEKSF